MKRVLPFVSTSIALASSSVSAQVANFEGFGAALNLKLVGASTKGQLVATDPAQPVFDGIGKTGAAASVQGSYGFALSKDAVLSVGGTYALTSPTIARIAVVGASVTGKAKSLASLYLEPGYLLSDKTMVYGKLTYESTKVSATSTVGVGISKNINGTGVGFGLRTMLDKSAFIQVGVKRIGYGAAKIDPADLTDFRTSATVGSVGVGMKF